MTNSNIITISCLTCSYNVIQQQVKGLSKEELETRNELVLALPERIQEIPDGTETAPKKAGIWAPSASHKNIKFDSSGNQCIFMFLGLLHISY